MKHISRLYNRSCAIIAILVLSSCSPGAAPKSKVLTTSDKVKEFSYELSGSLEIPTAVDPYYVAYLFDIYRPSLDHPDDAEATDELNRLIKSDEEFKSAFSRTYAHAFPIMTEDHSLDQSKVQYWITQQIRYTQNELLQKGISLTLKSVKSVQTSETPDKSAIIVNFKILALGVVDLNTNGGRIDLINSPIHQGDTLTVPLNVIDFYFESMGFSDFYRSSITKIRSDGLAAFLSDSEPSKLLGATKDNSVKNKCYTSDGDHISPFSYHYYFNPTLDGCLSANLKTSRITVENVSKFDSKTTYPEFHRLFEDKKVDIFVYYGHVDNEEIGASADLKTWLEGKGYQAVPVDSPSGTPTNHLKYSKVIEGIEVSVEWTWGIDPTAREAFLKSLKTHEVIVYDGHAGYGQTIDQKFAMDDSYPDDRYQVFMLNGCQTYKYGMTQLIDVKALHDFDFYNQNVDIITTFKPVSGHNQNKVLIESIDGAIPFFVENNWTPESKVRFDQDYTWLSIITKINAVSDEMEKDNGVFLVSGEEYNDYAPGKLQYPHRAELTEADLLSVLRDNFREENVRINALKAYAKKFLAADGNPVTIKDTLQKARQFCNHERYGDSVDSIFATVFFMPQCQIKKIFLLNDATYQDLTFSKEKPLVFYPNGTIKQAWLSTTQQVGEYALAGRQTTVFYDTGALRHFQAAVGFKDRTGRDVKQDSKVTLYPSGNIKSASYAEPITLKGMSFSGSTKFSENGELLEGVVFGPVSFAGFESKDKTFMRFDVAGNLTAVNSETLTSQRGDLKISGGHVELYSNGRYKGIFVMGEGKSFTLNGLEYFQIILREDGTRAFATMSSPFENDRMPCATGDRNSFILFDQKQTVVGCKLSRQFKIAAQTFEAGNPLIWATDGRIIDFADQAALNRYFKEIGFDFPQPAPEDLDNYEGNW